MEFEHDFAVTILENCLFLIYASILYLTRKDTTFRANCHSACANGSMIRANGNSTSIISKSHFIGHLFSFKMWLLGHLTICSFAKKECMQYRVGQRVRMLHESGEGVITQLIDRLHVEVDLGDGFPRDAHVSELIAIDRDEKRFLGDTEPEEKVQEKRENIIQVLGSQILELSLIVLAPEEADHMEVFLLNPEPTDILITCFGKKGKRYEGLIAGELNSGTYLQVGRMTKGDLNQFKSFFVQTLQFIPGSGHPHSPIERELKWNKSMLLDRPVYVQAFQKEGWAFSLREDHQQKEIAAIPQSEFVRVKKTQNPVVRKQSEVDLHIEELVAKPHLLAPSEMLEIQLQHLEKAIEKALREEYASLVVIHGVGTGVLKKAVQERLKTIPDIVQIEQADIKQYGNGATKAIFL